MNTVLTNKKGIYSTTDYYPFGQPLPDRSFSGKEYRFGFNGQEKDNDVTGKDATHTTAMFWEYDSRIGRRWNIDPVKKNDLSLYCTFSDNPIAKIDPNGDDDYYNKKGKKVGTDGKAGNVYIVTDNKVAKEMGKQFKRMNMMSDADKNSVSSSSFKLPSYTIRQAIKKSEEESNADRMHEEGGMAGIDKNGQEQIIPGTPGGPVDPFTVDANGLPVEATCNPLKPRNPLDIGKLETIEATVEWHIHPGKGRAMVHNGEDTYNGFKQLPSGDDFTALRLNILGGIISPGITEIVIGAATPLYGIVNKGAIVNPGAGQATIFNNSGTNFSMDKNIFYNLKSDGKGPKK